MAYIAKDDFTISISVEDLDQLLEEAEQDSGLTPDASLENASLTAQAFVRSYLKTLYLIDVEFALIAPIGTRNRLIIKITVDLALCILYNTISPRDIPELREKNCDSAKEWLIMASKQEIDPLVDPVTDPEPINIFQLGSNLKFISKPFHDQNIVEEQNLLP